MEESQDERSNAKGTWVKGGREEDNKRYKDFLIYCEERSRESRMLKEEDDDRKERAEMRIRQWDLMRLSIDYLKKNEPK